MSDKIISQVKDYLHDEKNYKWTTSKTLLDKLNIQHLNHLELDDVLLKYFQKKINCDIRFSSLPSQNNLDVLWGSVNRIKQKAILDIYRQDEQILIEELDRVQNKNMFLSHSFKDSKLAIEISKKLIDQNIFTWLAEIEILKHSHINQSVKNAIEKLPFFCVLISKNLINSVWSAKEIDFALRSDKEVIGIIDTKNLDSIDIIENSSTSAGTKISQEIFKRFFDNHPQVKFLFHPKSANDVNSNLVNQDFIVNWDYFKRQNKLVTKIKLNI
ncbi:toll/interleukin-1 receptor domain-containing protein [Mariniflexile sp. AS56]|uniref:toll/interleukin-1 receptor domain-containing protein n=1 Tax=Mariniflexile sp. AS56 TaxID=3063957 RepID=UPI0026EB0A7B|nr:toll/interleukin-1 receptor domain-containing protein [Mariniflexile sp. AS56]MDO7173836.1 toll/interleukin-1 receptor domain-containing protein [Mariniflexile sp. AS56]